MKNDISFFHLKGCLLACENYLAAFNGSSLLGRIPIDNVNMMKHITGIALSAESPPGNFCNVSSS